MLIRIVVNNIFSFGEEKEFNTIPHNRLKTLNHHKYKINGFEILKTSAIYGANGAGKSNLVKSISLLQDLVIEEKIPYKLRDSEFKFNDLKASFYLTVKGKLGAQLSVTEKLERRQLFKTDVIKLVASKVKELTAPEAPNIRMNRDEALCYDENLQFSHALAKYEYQRQVYTEIIEFLENPANDNGA